MPSVGVALLAILAPAVAGGSAVVLGTTLPVVRTVARHLRLHRQLRFGHDHQLLKWTRLEIETEHPDLAWRPVQLKITISLMPRTSSAGSYCATVIHRIDSTSSLR